MLLNTVLLLALGGKLVAQSTDKSDEKEKGYTLYEQFGGSSNTLGQVMKFDTSVGYDFNKFFGLDLGIPFYIVRSSTTSTSPTSPTPTKTSTNGLGDAYVDLRLTVDNPLVNYGSTLTGRGPTGDTSSGLSTGRGTFDWSNHFDRSFMDMEPFVNLGVANSIADTHFFTRPFTTLGKVGHFEGGASYKILRVTSVGASLYDDLPWGSQKVFSKLIKRQTAGGTSKRRRGGVFENAAETTGGADIARDNGFSAWFDAGLKDSVDFEIGYNRSVHYDLNTVSFGIGFNLGNLISTGKRH